ncbi:MAG TPA: FtsX-like permease family protein [Gaiellaceae bacterium]|nr:FtsX-like permease family protein [Gaiellaceae bacterium]
MSAMLLIALLVASPFLFILARRPILRRLAVRNAARRPREAMLVILGSLLGAAIITGSAVVGDTMDASIRQAARQHLGPIDELVVARSAGEWRSIQGRLRALPTSSVDGVVPLASFATATTAGAGGALRTVPNAQVVGLDFDAAHVFGSAGAATGVFGPTPAPGHAAITTDLARALELGPGGEIDVYAYGRPSTLTVDRVLPRVGLAGFSLTGQQEARNVLVSPSVFSAMAHRRPAGVAPPSWYVAVSNRGGIESGASLSKEVTRSIEQATAGIDPQVTDVKQQFLDVADETGKTFTQMFTAMGSFGVFAGLLLLINLFVMLASERKSELGMARAVGMRRSQLVGAFATEGFIYALLATLLGTAVGVGLGRVLVAWSQSAFSSEHNRFDLYFTVKPDSLAQSFVVGFVVAVATIVVMSIRVSRLNIIRAIRDIAEPPPRRRKRWLYAGFAAVALGALWTVSATASKEPFGLLLGPTLVFVGLAPVLTRIAPARTAASVLAAATVTWGALVFALFPDSAEGASIMMYVAQGIVMTAGGVAFATLQLDRLSSALHRFGGRVLALRLGLAYPLARRGRTGLTVSMYALVVFILTFITSISFMIDNQVSAATADVSGGAQVFVRSSAANPVSISALTQTPGVDGVAPLSQAQASFALANSPEEHFWPMTAYDSSLLQLGPPALEDRGFYRTDLDAWTSVLSDPNLIIADPMFLQQGGPPNFSVKVGDRMTIINPLTGASRDVAVAAVATGDGLIANGMLYGRPGAHQLFGDRLVPSRSYVSLVPGMNAETFAANLQSEFITNGTEAFSIAALTDEAFSMTHQIFQLFQGYLAMGLLVGIAGIAVVMIRAVRERRRQIGTLRALGFPAHWVGRSFAIEAAYIALQGTLIGALLALLTLYTIVARSDAMGDVTFAVPYVQLAVLLGGTVVASLAATIAPAMSATRIKPAVALRMTS